MAAAAAMHASTMLDIWTAGALLQAASSGLDWGLHVKPNFKDYQAHLQGDSKLWAGLGQGIVPCFDDHQHHT